MRNIIDVIDKVLAVVPVSEEQAVSELNSLRSTCQYSPPEQAGFLWNLFVERMNCVVSQPPLLNAWEIKAVAIFMDKTEEEISNMYGPGNPATLSS